ISIWHIKPQSSYGQLAISITSGQYGHVIILWTICGHLTFGAFMTLHLNPEAIAAIYTQLGISGHFPQNQGKWPKWLFLAIWADNAHFCAFAHICKFLCPLRICAHLRTLTQSVQKTLSRPLGQFLAQHPKVAKIPKGHRSTFSSSEAITSILLTPSFHLMTFGRNLFPMNQYAIYDVIYHHASFFNRNSMVAISNGHFNIPTYHHVIKAPNYSEDSSRLKSKCFSFKDQSCHQDVIG
ncbi:hypothetical protein O181_131606, partial [Austropuccinia psidii MF-1]|nr:hypothetical protein [Austropuccinia psidii MF-1]